MIDPETDVAPVERARGMGVVFVAIALFAATIALRLRVDPWLTTAGAGAIAIALSVWTLGRVHLAKLFSAQTRHVLYAILAGIALVIATHAAYRLLPFTEVYGLYGSIAGGHPRWLLALITFGVVVAEELVWRGVALELVKPRRLTRIGAPLAVALYVAPQLIGGVWLLMLAALGLGIVFTYQRIATRSLTPPIITHAIWSVAIFVVVPLA